MVDAEGTEHTFSGFRLLKANPDSRPGYSRKDFVA